MSHNLKLSGLLALLAFCAGFWAWGGRKGPPAPLTWRYHGLGVLFYLTGLALALYSAEWIAGWWTVPVLLWGSSVVGAILCWTTDDYSSKLSTIGGSVLITLGLMGSGVVSVMLLKGY